MSQTLKTRRTLLGGVLLVFASTSTVTAQTSNVPEPSQWKRYTVKGAEFSVTLPSFEYNFN